VSDSVYVVSIDLGTTNSVVAYTETALELGEQPHIRVLDIPQLVEAGTVEKRSVLPSFVYMPGQHDVADDALELPWGGDRRLAVGEYARERGAEIPQRLISSSKSWLCHTLVDRNNPILPWEGPEDIEKLSPVEASSMVLRHIKEAWNDTMAQTEEGYDEQLLIENQDIFLTVPASFDAVARDLTIKAAEMAGLSHVTLLEEPQAAFYAWIEAAGEKWRKQIQKDDLVLVCDVGGGTSDFSLIRVSEENGELVLERIAVGDHLLVGGDNMDLALAYSVANKMAQKGSKLDSWQMRGLWHSCRKAKESILGDPDCEKVDVTILGRGSSLIGGTIKSEIDREDLYGLILNGFMPHCEFDAQPAVQQKSGIRELGLAYESDPSVTRHLAAFLNRQGDGDLHSKIPTAVLFNGGVMKAHTLRERIMEVVNAWGDGGAATAVRELDTSDYDLAVARGAAYYGLARRGQGVRIRGGLGKSYYIGIAASMPAVPGMPTPLKALCVAPFGMEEGTEQDISEQEFVLLVGESVKFDFLGSSIRKTDASGVVVEDWQGEIEEITTLETILDGETGQAIPVVLEVRATEIGTLELWCVSKADGRRWKLEFNVREKE
jgi:hypothetical protein